MPLRLLLPLLVPLALAACRPVEPSLPPSGLHIRVTPKAGFASVTTGALLVTVTVGGLAGVAVDCALITLRVDGFDLASQEPDCGPDEVDHDGGVWSRTIALGPGDHDIEVRATEPGCRPVRAYQIVRVLA
jgi:hypothetical protein